MQSLKELANKAAHAYSTRFSTYIESDPLGADQQHVWSFMFAITQPHKGVEILRLYVPQIGEKFSGVRLTAPSQETFSLKRRDDHFVIDIGTHTQDFVKLDTPEQQHDLLNRIIVWAMENMPEGQHPDFIQRVAEAEDYMKEGVEEDTPRGSAAGGFPGERGVILR